MSVSAAYTPTPQTGVRVEGDMNAAVAVMTVRGRWDHDLCDSVTIALHKCLAEHPEALIVDLAGLDDPDSLSAPTWESAQRAAAQADPPMQFALCAPPDNPVACRMQHLGTGRYLPVYARLRQARVAIAGRLPEGERMTLALQPDPDAPSLARNLVSDACLTWRMGDLLHSGRQVMSELVTNAVEHAGTPMTVVVARRGSVLHLAVSDDVEVGPRLLRPARPRRGEPLDERGRGLRIVIAVAGSWGWLPTRTGKVVWATMQPARVPIPPRQRDRIIALR